MAQGHLGLGNVESSRRASNVGHLQRIMDKTIEGVVAGIKSGKLPALVLVIGAAAGVYVATS